MNINKLPYLNYPNPRLRRKNYQILNGIWDFAFIEKMEIPESFDKKIKVPFTYETEYSLINQQELHEYIAYRRKFKVDKANYLLHFEGVDYQTKVFIDRKEVYSHCRAYSPFVIPLSLDDGEHEIVVLVHDTYNKWQMRGKQRTRGENYECWYTQFTGIFQDVYLEKVGNNYFEKVLFSGDKNGLVTFDIDLKEKADVRISIFQKETLVDEFVLQGQKHYSGTRQEKNIELYSHENPCLYDVKLEIEKEDEVETYFGFRTIENKDGKLFINDKPLYLRMILNQGYYFKKGVTPEKDDVILDLSLIEKIGFNGIRIHQKQEVNLFYYIADNLGIYLWSEIPSCYEYSENMKEEVENEIPQIIEKNFNSPSIITYVIFNESWGIPEINTNEECQAFVNKIGAEVKKYDSTRLVILNDGWFQLTGTDILSLHEYEQNPTALANEYIDQENVLKDKIINHYGKAFASGNKYQGQPIILSEFGGASLKTSDGWGYGEKMQNISDYKKQLENIFAAVRKLDYLSGYCYTQLTDVEQETNGLFYADRQAKLPLEEMRKIILGE